MLTELETELIAAVKGSPIAANLRDVAAMPDGDGDTLVKRFAAIAPAVYVVAGAVNFIDCRAKVKFDLICMARNARGNDAARRGDGQTIGLYQILDALAAHLDSHRTASTIWNVASIDFAKAAIWMNNGLSVASLRLTAEVMQTPLDESILGDFVTFHADYDIDPFQPHTEHVKWAAEPPDLTVSAPELTETITLPQ